MVAAKKQRYVVDASFVLAFLLQENNLVDKYFLKHVNNEIALISSSLLVYEVGNGIKSAVRSKRITSQQAKDFFEHFQKLGINEEKLNFSQVFMDALNSKLTFYDASYRTLSKKIKVRLLTLDTKLAS